MFLIAAGEARVRLLRLNCILAQYLCSKCAMKKSNCDKAQNAFLHADEWKNIERYYSLRPQFAQNA